MVLFRVCHPYRPWLAPPSHSQNIQQVSAGTLTTLGPQTLGAGKPVCVGKGAILGPAGCWTASLAPVHPRLAAPSYDNHR